MRVSMVELPSGERVTDSEALTALAVEAKKRGVNYGQLIATTDQLEREQIVKDYYWLQRRKARRSRR